MGIKRSVGRMACNAPEDVLFVQTLFHNIYIRGRFGRERLWKPRPDTRYKPDMEAAIRCFQRDKGLPDTGKLEADTRTNNVLNRAMPPSMRTAGATARPPAGAPRPQANTRPVGVPGLIGDAERDSIRCADDALKNGPFPRAQRTQLSELIKEMGRTVGVCLRPEKPRVTNAGCFAVDLKPVPPLAGSEADRRPVMAEICTRINRNPAWRTDMMTGNLTLTTKQSWPVLKSLPALGARHQAALNLTAAPPDNAVVKAGLAAMGEAVDGRRRIDDLAILNDIPPLVKFAEASINTSDLSPARKQEIEDKVRAADITPPEKIEDFCGPSDDPVASAFIPDNLIVVDFTEACRKHDKRYETCGISRIEADNRFLQDMMDAVISQNIFPRSGVLQWIAWKIMGMTAAFGYYWGVWKYGDTPYENAQREAGCVNEDVG